MPTRFALIATILLSFASTPASAQESGEATLQTTTIGAVLRICVEALDRKLDINNADQLGEWSLTPGTAAVEADMRRDIPGLEVAEASFSDGTVFLGFIPGVSCSVQIKGPGRIAVRDALIRTMLETGVDQKRSVSDTGTELLAFPFSNHPVYVSTDARGGVMVQVR